MKEVEKRKSSIILCLLRPRQVQTTHVLPVFKQIIGVLFAAECYILINWEPGETQTGLDLSFSRWRHHSPPPPHYHWFNIQLRALLWLNQAAFWLWKLNFNILKMSSVLPPPHQSPLPILKLFRQRALIPLGNNSFYVLVDFHNM